MKLQVTFTVDVDWCDEVLGPVKPGDPLRDRIEDSVAEAVANCLAQGMNEGYSHDMEALIAILMDSSVVAAFVD